MAMKSETGWYCYGDRSEHKEGHPEQLNTGDSCTYPGCGLSRPEDENPNPDLETPIPNPISKILKPNLSDKKEAEPDKDKVLLVFLAALNLGSWYTTIVGANQILPGLAGIVTGTGVQSLLYLLLSGYIVRDYPIRKWLGVGVLSFMSIYTSFFAYYDFLTGSGKKREAIQIAIIASQQVRSEVLAPLETNVRQLEGEIQQLKTERQKEIDGSEAGYLPGEGPKAQALQRQILLKENELAKLKPNVEEFQRKFLSPRKEDSPEEIFQKTIQALELVPNEYRPQKYQGDLNKLRSIFFDKDQEAPLLTPYLKVRKGEESAIAAMLLAVVVDGIIIVLGTAIEKRGKVEAYIPLQGKASDFLHTLFNAIEPTTGLIKYDNLMRHPEKQGFILLLNTMRIPTLGWVEVRSTENSNQWYLSQKKRDNFIKWYAEEIKYQSEIQAQNPSEIPQGVTFILPYRK